MKKLGFIGYGLRSEYMVRALREMQVPLAPAAIADPRCEELRAKLGDDPYFAQTEYYTDAAALLQQPLDCVFIGTRCNLHTPIARQVLAQKLPLFLEKPVCISAQQYALLRQAGEGQEHRVLVSFPLRFTPIVQAMQDIVQGGDLGTVTMVQAVNNVPYGSVYFHSWYRDAALTGGLFLQKATHDIDYIRYISGLHPVKAAAFTAKMYFTGQHPAGITCPQCAENKTCVESSYAVEKLFGETPTGEECCFAVDTGNEDNAAVLLQARGGAIINYSQSFIVKKSAQRRGARFIGTRGSAEFDFYTGEIRVDQYHSKHIIRHCIEPVYPQHFGGDNNLALAFGEMMEGKPSRASLFEGLASAACCLAAQQAAQSGNITEIEYGF